MNGHRRRPSGGAVATAGAVWLRHRNVVGLIDAFALSAVTSLLLVRLYLFLAGYPKVGGGGLHIAHMVWGGLLMVAALIVAVSSVAPGARWFTAVLGGLGFGLFVDEIGKFLTSDNNYFFRPAAALIYVIFLTLFLLARALTRRQWFTPDESLANAIELLKEAPLKSLDEHERAEALHFLARAGDSPLAVTLRSLFETLPREETPSPAMRFRGAIRRRYERLCGASWFSRTVGALVVGSTLGTLLEVALILTIRSKAWDVSSSHSLNSFGPFSFIAAMEIGASVVMLAFAVLGFALGTGRPTGLHWLERALLVGILLVQPFAFYEAQFFASAGVVSTLPLLGVVRYMLHQETRRERRSTPAGDAQPALEQPVSL